MGIFHNFWFILIFSNFTFYFLFLFISFILFTKWCEMIKAEEKMPNQSDHWETEVSENKLAKLLIFTQKAQF